MSDFLDMLRDVPPMLAAAWGGWLAVGLLLLLWHLRGRVWEREHALLRAEARQSRVKPVGRPASGERPHVTAPPGDAFGDLEALLEASPSASSDSRRPGD